jgi:hypothetical protein
MPEYDFRCPRGHVTTVQASIMDGPPALVACDTTDGTKTGTCGLEAVRVYGTPTLIFDGTGHGVGHTWQKGSYE